MFRATSLATRATLFLSVLVSTLAVLGRAEDQRYPQITVSDGNIVITPATSKNITFDHHDSESYVNIGPYNVVHLLSSMGRGLKTLSFARQSYDSQLNIKIIRIRNSLNGIVKRLDRLNRDNMTETFMDDKLMLKRINSLQSHIARIENLLMTNKCNWTPCKNGGTCINTFQRFVCLCPEMWQGIDCTTDVDECTRFNGTSLGCQNGATCTNKVGSYECTCSPGWHGIHCMSKKTNCEGSDIELCGQGTCHNNTDGGSFTCDCKQGWTTDGVNPACTKDIDECEVRNSCSLNPPVPCINIPGSFHCGSCPSGFTGDGYICNDIDECLINNGDCSTTPLVQCINTFGDRICGPCPPGFDGDGTTCSYKGICHVNNGGCHPLAVCSENPTISWTYVDCACPAGYVGHGYGIDGCMFSSSNAIQEITEVPSFGCNSNSCIHGKCVDGPNGHICICHEGFSGSKCETIVNECSTFLCENGGTCIKDDLNDSSYKCECKPGYTGITCQDTTSECDGTFYTEEGNITFLPEGDVICTWVIETKSDMVLNLTFDKFKMEESVDCTHSFLMIHDGENIADRVIGKYCGFNLPHNGSIISTKNSLYLRYESNSTNVHNNFSFNWVSIPPVCGGNFIYKSHGSISSPGSPGKYPVNRDCFWTVTAPPGKKIMLNFFTLQIKSDINCSTDYLEIRENRKLPELARYCNYTVPPPLTSPGSSFSIHFHSDEKDTDYGFQLTYSIIEGIPGCGGVYTKYSQNLSPPSINGIYLSNIMCEYLIRVDQGMKVNVSFLKFDLENSIGCRHDYLAAYDGPTDKSKLIGKYCGSEKPASFISTSNTLLLVFMSDYMFSFEGFLIYYSRVCSEIFTQSTGVIQSPGYPKEYPKEMTCYYLIEPENKKAIVLDFIDFEMENSQDSTNCTFDYLKIFDNGRKNDGPVEKYCGNKIPERFTSSLNFLGLLFHSDRSITKRGFKANYSTIDLGCGYIFTKDFGYVNWPENTEIKSTFNDDLKSCSWYILSRNGFSIELRWVYLNIAISDGCNKSYVQIKDGNQYLGKFCGFKNPPIMTSLSGKFNITLVSEFSQNLDTFSIYYKLFDKDKDCNRYYFSSYGSITSPGWPEPYSIRKNCTWIIQAPLGQQIELNFTTFSLEYLENCAGDYLEIRNGGYENAPLIGKFCGKLIPKVIPSLTNSLYLRFISDGSKNDQGFHLTWESTSTGCGGTLTSHIGTFYSPNYPQSLNTKVECYWKISTSLGSRLEFTFDDLKVGNCTHNYVELYNSIDSETGLIQKFCDLKFVETSKILSSSNHVFIKFHSDMISSGSGFKLNYVTVCDKNITGFSGIIESPNFPNKYPRMFDCVWAITVSKGNKINITFSHFDLDLPYIEVKKNSNEAVEGNDSNTSRNCTYDFLELLDESTQHSNDRRYCGNEIPPTYTTTGNKVSINFETNDLSEFTGFRLEWNIVGCGGHLRHPSGTLETPGYPKKYPANTECKWTIEVEPYMSVKLVILEFHVESSCYDNLTVYDSQDVGPLIMTTLCVTKSVPVELTSSSKYMHVVFSSNGMYSGRGFKAKYESVPNRCGGKFINIMGNITSPKYPENYENGLHCLWEIEILKHQRIYLEFLDFHMSTTLENDNITCSDYINIYDGDQPHFEKLIAKNLCGNHLNITSYVSKTNKMLIEMIATKGHAKGFNAKYVMACGSNIHTKTEGFIDITDDLYYFHNTHEKCLWTIIADEPGKRVSLTFTYLKFTSSNQATQDCENRKISVYNGESNQAPLIRQICRDKSPPTIVSSGNAISIELEISDVDSNMFEVHYTFVSTACGGDLLSEHGSFASPMYPDSYPPRAECVWRLLPSPGNRIALSFVEFDVEISDNCDRDYVEVRETNGTGKILGIYCGDEIPTNNTFATSLWVKFRADSDGTSKGFLIDYSYIHGNEIYGDSGIITNPMYPKAYMQTVNRDDFFWRINVPLEFKIRITFKEISTSSLDECVESNGVYVHDGYSNVNTVIATACGFDVPEPVESSSNNIYITFNSVGIRGSRFMLEWTRVERITQRNDNIDMKDCNDEKDLVISLAEDAVYELNFRNVHDGAYCDWKFETDSLHHLSIQFLLYETIPSHECMTDDVVLISRWANIPGYFTKTHDICNPTTLKTPIDVGNQLHIQLRSYFDSGNFSALVYPKCGGNVTLLDGVLSPSFVNTSEFKMFSITNQPTICEWVVKVRPGRTIQFRFSEMNITNELGECNNYIMIRNGGFSDSPFLGKGKYCENTEPTESFETISNYLYVKFSTLTHPLFNKNTFKLKFNEISATCDYRLTLTHNQREVNISSPNYPNIPNPYTRCTWVILAPVGERIKVHFIERFDLTPERICVHEYVEIREGGTSLSESLGRFCKRNPPTVKTKNNVVYIDFVTDVDDPKNGFKATISIDICGGVVHATSGTITLMKNLILANQKSDILCEWTIINPTNNGLSISVRTLELPPSINCSSAYFQIIEETPMKDISFNHTDPICKLNETITVTTVSEQAAIKIFIKKQTIKNFNYDMFVTFNNTMSLCGGTFSTPEGFLFGPNYRSANSHNYYTCIWKIQVPKGRRITLEILSGFIEYSENGRFPASIFIYEFDSRMDFKYSQENRIVESSDNTMHVYWSGKITENRFKAHYTSEKKTLCNGDFSQPLGAIFPPMQNSLVGTPPVPYYCQYTRTPPERKSVSTDTDIEMPGTNYTLTLKMEEVALSSNRECGFRSSKITIFSEKLTPSTLEFCGNYTSPLIIRRVNTMTKLSISDRIGTGKYSIVYETFPCGGIINDVKSGYKFKIRPTGSLIDCVWVLIPPEGGILQVSMKNVKLTGPCEEEYLWLLDSKNDYIPAIVLCSNNVTSVTSKSSSVGFQIEYHTDRFYQQTNLDIEIVTTVRGCGGKPNNDEPFSTPNFPSSYGPNEECIWEIDAPPGYRVMLFFENRFSLEKSENCSKDFVEVFDVFDNKWSSLGKFCGRELPGELKSTSNKMKVLFRSDFFVNGDGFQARWKTFCGGKLDVTNSRKTLISPITNDYFSDLKCEYSITPPDGKSVKLTFEKFDLDKEEIGLCESEYLKINTRKKFRWIRHQDPKTYCGTEIPKTMSFSETFNITFKTQAWTPGSGFIMHYEIDECVTIINSSQKISLRIPLTIDDSKPNIFCSWNITAPPSMIVLLRFKIFEIPYDKDCDLGNLSIYDGNEINETNTLANLCGSHVRSLPVIKSYTNQLLMILKSKHSWISMFEKNEINFDVDVMFTYGESYGCGGKYKIAPNAPFNFEIGSEKLYKPSMDCQWVISTNKSDVIRLEFNSFHIAPCENVNRINRCDCDFIEVRDGFTFTDILIGKYCGHDLPREIVSSGNYLWIQFVTDGTIESSGINTTFTSVPSICGERFLPAQDQLKELTFPKNADGSVMKGVNCAWKIETSYRHIRLRLSYVDLSPMSENGRCSNDILMLSHLPITSFRREGAVSVDLNIPNGIYPAFKYIYCGKFNTTEHHIQSPVVYVSLRTSTNTDHYYTGFKLDYSEEGCNRNYTDDYGKINYLTIDRRCTIILQTNNNRTISLYFNHFYVEKNLFFVKDGISSDSAILFEAKENHVVSNPIFSFGNVLRIEILKRFFSIENMEFIYVVTDKGRGCGGILQIDSGRLTSPLYPYPYREANKCVWEITTTAHTMVSVEFKVFDLSADIPCDINYVELINRDGSSIAKYCPRDVPAIRNSNSNYLKITQQGSINNKGSGWMLIFTAVNIF